jgi:hypothetical protein
VFAAAALQMFYELEIRGRTALAQAGGAPALNQPSINTAPTGPTENVQASDTTRNGAVVRPGPPDEK